MDLFSQSSPLSHLSQIQLDNNKIKPCSAFGFMEERETQMREKPRREKERGDDGREEEESSSCATFVILIMGTSNFIYDFGA